MIDIKGLVIAAAGLAASLSSAAAASSEWYQTDGGRIRIVANAPEPGEASFKGVLQVQLQPGWKTYWRDPGSSGVPPRVDVSQTPEVGAVDIGFPPPHRFKDPYGSWAGYKTSTNFALTFSVSGIGAPSVLHAGVFLGICQEICIPVDAEFTINFESSVPDPADESLIEAVFATLPEAANPDFGATAAVQGKDGRLLVTTRLPDPGEKPELFVENAGGWYFGDPEIISTEGAMVRFSLPVLEAPAKPSDTVSLPYTLLAAGRSVEGKIALAMPSQ